MKQQQFVSFFIQLCVVSTLLTGIYTATVFLKDGAGTNEWEVYSSEFQLPWAQARDYCTGINMSLISVDNVKKDSGLVDFFIDGAGADLLIGNAWISATETVEGVWQFDSTKKPCYHTRWFVGQPDDIGNLNCAYLAKSAMLYWRDANCSAPMYFLCERGFNLTTQLY